MFVICMLVTDTSNKDHLDNERFYYWTKQIIIVIVNSRFIHCPQKWSCGTSNTTGAYSKQNR